MERKKLKKKGIGSACAILSATLFGFNAYCATNAYAEGLSAGKRLHADMVSRILKIPVIVVWE